MIVFRLSKSKYSNDLSGYGAEKYGRRWNSIGTAMVYTSSSRSLCVLEVAVNLPLSLAPKDYQLISIEIPDGAGILELETPNLPGGWKSFPYSASTQQIGDRFISNGQYLIMKAPSAVVQGDFNYLLNPKHADFKKVRILGKEPFQFDERLFGK